MSVGRLAGRAAIVLACLVAVLFVILAGTLVSGLFKHFHVPAEAMAPTLEKGDWLVARLDGAGALRRGDVVMVAVGRATYVKRVAALAGDTIGLSEGVVTLNGRPVAQRLIGTELLEAMGGPRPARRLAERFPGEAGEHRILDLEASMVDDMAELRVPPGHLFVLGDNRDRSADSRVPREHMGTDVVPVADIRGHALFYLWPWSKAGERIR